MPEDSAGRSPNLYGSGKFLLGLLAKFMTIDNRSLSGLIRSVIQTHPKKILGTFSSCESDPKLCYESLGCTLDGTWPWLLQLSVNEKWFNGRHW